jgi:hypothetical protein
VAKYCPKSAAIIRASRDWLDVFPDEQIAGIKKILININEKVFIRPLTCHNQMAFYCPDYQETATGGTVVKKACNDLSLTYLHFYIHIHHYRMDESDYLIVFLPREKDDEELGKAAQELYQTAKWLNIEK